MNPYQQYPYKAQIKSENHFRAHLWCSKNIMKGLWSPDYERPNAFKFTLEKDYVIFLLRWS